MAKSFSFRSRGKNTRFEKHSAKRNLLRFLGSKTVLALSASTKDMETGIKNGGLKVGGKKKKELVNEEADSTIMDALQDTMRQSGMNRGKG